MSGHWLADNSFKWSTAAKCANVSFIENLHALDEVSKK